MAEQRPCMQMSCAHTDMSTVSPTASQHPAGLGGSRSNGSILGRRRLWLLIALAVLVLGSSIGVMQHFMKIFEKKHGKDGSHRLASTAAGLGSNHTRLDTTPRGLDDPVGELGFPDWTPGSAEGILNPQMAPVGFYCAYLVLDKVQVASTEKLGTGGGKGVDLKLDRRLSRATDLREVAA